MKALFIFKASEFRIRKEGGRAERGEGEEMKSLFIFRDWVLLNKVRGQDVQLLRALGVTLICDLMVEKKKLKYGL